MSYVGLVLLILCIPLFFSFFGIIMWLWLGMAFCLAAVGVGSDPTKHYGSYDYCKFTKPNSIAELAGNALMLGTPQIMCVVTYKFNQEQDDELPTCYY